MSDKQNVQIGGADYRYFAKILEYPGEYCDVIAANRPMFKPQGEKPPRKPRRPQEGEEKPKKKGNPKDLERAQSRARATVRRLALANEDFEWFVTLTIDPEKIDSYDAAACTRKLSQWLSNRVKRQGLKYVIVPERHKSGRIHYHGLINDALEAVPSGHQDSQGHEIYNLPDWDYGYTTAIRLYGERRAAVGYVCKYIGKESEKIGGRWYYSGGDLAKPVEKFVDIPSWELMEAQTEEFVEEYGQGWTKATPVAFLAGINGIRKEAIENGSIGHGIETAGV